MRYAILFALFCSAFASAQSPLIYYRGIVNSADFAPAGLPNGGVAQGSIFSIFGSGLGPATGVSASQYPLGTTLAGVSIKLSQGSTQVNILPVYVGSTIINAIMPSNAPLGMVSVQVTYSGHASNASPLKVVTSAFHLYTLNGTGSGPGAILNFNTDGTEPVNSLHNAAYPGQTIIAYGTGLGPITAPDNAAPPVGNLPVQVEAWVGGASAPVAYSGRASAGEDQINLTIPSNAPTGCWVPVYFRVAGTITSNATTIAIAPQGQSCSDPANALSQKFINGGKVGTINLLRSNTLEDIATDTPINVQGDFLVSDFANVPGGPFAFASLFSQPPPGTCTLIAGPGDLLKVRSASQPNPPPRLNAGASFTLSGPGGSKQLTSPFPQAPAAALGSFAPFLAGLPNQLFLSPGGYSLSAAGGSDVGAFQASLNMPPAFTWTGQAQLNSVNRSQPLALSWSGLPAGQSMAIIGGNVDLPSNSTALFYCLAPANATSFTIPAAILGAIPQTQANVLRSRGAIYLTTITPANGTAFSAPGIDAGLAVSGYMLGKTVIFP